MGGPLDDRIRRRRRDDDRDAVDRAKSEPSDGAPAYIGQVYDAGALPTAVPRFFATRPVTVSGNESENATPTLTLNTDVNVPVLVLGPHIPIAGENLLARMIGGRWVAGTPTTGEEDEVVIIGCDCPGMPEVISMVVSGTCTNGLPGNIAQYYSCTIRYVPIPAGLLAIAVLGHIGPGGVRYAYLSDETFTDSADDPANPFRFYLWCFGNAYILSRAYEVSLFGTPFLTSSTYTWSIGLPGNTCEPFAMTSGTPLSGTCSVDLLDAT